MDIHVGNLSYEATEEDLRGAFEPFGLVQSISIVKDKRSGRSKGFGFVMMPAEAEARSAISGLNGKELKGRVLKVGRARPRPRGGHSGGRQGRRWNERSGGQTRGGHEGGRED